MNFVVFKAPVTRIIFRKVTRKIHPWPIPPNPDPGGNSPGGDDQGEIFRTPFRKYSDNNIIFLKYYCFVSHLKYYKVIFFSWIINEKKYFLFHVSIKPVWKKHEIKIFRLWNLSNFIVLTSKLLIQKMSRVTFCENRQIKRNVILEVLSCDFDESES